MPKEIIKSIEGQTFGGLRNSAGSVSPNNMSREEEIDYWRDRANRVAELLEEIELKIRTLESKRG